MSYNEEDFTIENYRKLLRKISRRSIFYDEINNKCNFTLWRHDIDFSVHRAYALAKIEREENIKATYFVQLGSTAYNTFEQEIKDIIFGIISLGHQIGLHFDPTQYNIKSRDDLERYLKFEKNILENLFQLEIKVFSFHNPTENILKNDDLIYSGMINTYAKYFKENVEYCSDSNGYWRFKRLENFLDKNFEKIQVLTHPEWWQEEVMKPRDRIERCIYGRAKKTIDIYDSFLDSIGRINVR